MSEQMTIGAAVDTYLQGVVHQMVTSGAISKEMADIIVNEKPQWINQFAQNPNIHGCSTTTFQGELRAFLDGLVRWKIQQMGAGQYGGTPYQNPHASYGGMPMAEYGGGYGNGGVDSGYGGGYGTHSEQHHVPFVPGARTGPTSVANMREELGGGGTVVEETVVANTLPKQFVPNWVSNTDLVKTEQICDGGGNTGLFEARYPSNDHELGIVFVGMECKESTFGDAHDIVAFLNRHYHDVQMFARIRQRVPVSIRKANKEAVMSTIEELNKISIGSMTTLEAFDNVCDLLRNKPVNIFSAIEKIIVSVFNQAFAGRALLDQNNINYNIKIGSIQHILDFSPEANVGDYSAFTSQTGYARAYEDVIKHILSTLSSLNHTTNRKLCLTAAKGLRGSEGIVWERRILDEDDGLGKFLETHTVISYLDEFCLTNINMESNVNFSNMFRGEDGSGTYCVVVESSGNLDHVLKRMLRGSFPSQVFDMNNKLLFTVGETIGSQYVYSIPE